ncbi:hypothetical protein BGX33_000278 [Mortierella sp. NVP41]|nr:hypothetical protein BGX33_000278 [Mortierella sp. NVP41]
MEPGTSDSTAALQGDVDILRQELLHMEAKREALLRQIEQEEQSLLDDDPTQGVPQPTLADDQEQKRLQDILMAYRLTGVTLFNGDEFNQQDWSQYGVTDLLDGPKDAGIRFDTFALRKYYEPYYIMLRTTPKGRKNRTADDEDMQLDPRRSTFEIAKHTIPHWIPLRELEKHYLNRDISTFTRSVSDYLQAFVTRRENIQQLISTFTLDDSILTTNEETEADPDQPQAPITLPRITCQTKDAAIRDVVLSCFRYDALFTLYHRRQAREQKRNEAKAKSKASGFTSTTATTNFSTLMGDYQLDMDIDNEESEEQGERKEDLELLKGPVAALSVQIHLVYDDLKSTMPSRAEVQFSKGHDAILLDRLSTEDSLRAQHAQWN